MISAAATEEPPPSPATATATELVDPGAQALLTDSRGRARQWPDRADLVAQAALGVGFTMAAVALLLLAPRSAELDVGVLLGLVVLYALACRATFEIGTGFTAPTLLVVVPALFLLPPEVVPLAVAAGDATARLISVLAGTRHPIRILQALTISWYAIGPALVFVIWTPGDPAIADAPVYLLALTAMIAFDATSSGLYDRFGLKVPLRSILASGAWVYGIDALLFPVGLLIAFGVAGTPELLVLLCPLLAVLAIFGRERSKAVTHALELGRAYRGTALLLGQVVEADDAYTGAHSRDVVELALEVAAGLGLTPVQRRNLEFGAMLHDIGKITVPKSIINKPGALSPEEWGIIRQHTVEGQRMLAAVGGVLELAGHVVRSSHERWDGRGYPDGLKGEQIGIEARICTACDAFAAMTTDRSYRPAMSVDAAIGELRLHSGSQFDPAVVDRLVTILRP